MTLPIINCEGCGACCMEMGCPPFYSHHGHDPEFDAMPTARK